MSIYSETHGVVTAEDGTPIEIVVKNVNIDPGLARFVFDLGSQVGDWHWKHQVWNVTQLAQDPGIEFSVIQAAARFFYGWDGSNEKVTQDPETGVVTFEAWYCC